MLSYNDIDKLNMNSRDREELKILVAGTDKFLRDSKQNPKLRTQFLQEIGLLDADGNRKVFPGEEPLNPNAKKAKNGDAT